MKYIADLHIHSPFSRATSKLSNLLGLAAWSRIKGIHVLGTGDFTHPGWFRLLKEQLVPAEPGFFKLKEKYFSGIAEVFASLDIVQKDISLQAAECRFVLTAEISSIYKRGGKVRKVHNILFAPDFESAERISTKLAAIGNIESDGRPILGLDSHDLLEILLEQSPEGFLVPAHIWTPWFSLFGSKSGFDSIEECFGDLTKYIFALETGLSSDPDMNRCVTALDSFALISNSDCHSPSKLGREANIFQTDFHFFAMRDALRENNKETFLGTIEFYPEEGKYHYDGHRKCNTCFEPLESKKNNGICPVCLKPLTIGVTHRVMELADRLEPSYIDTSPGFYSLIPLPEVIGEILCRGPNTKGVMQQYVKLISLFGSEFSLLFDTPIDEIEERFSSVLAEAIARIRTGRVIRKPGYDGEFGVIKVFTEDEIHTIGGQKALFATSTRKRKKKKAPLSTPDMFSLITPDTGNLAPVEYSLNSEQQAAVESNANHIIVTAGPGTGKTHTLIARLNRLLSEDSVDPQSIAVITFTNRAADEVTDRLLSLSGKTSEHVFVGTFHAFCLQWLRLENPDLLVVGEETRKQILKQLYPGITPLEEKELQQELAAYFDQQNAALSSAQNNNHITAPISDYCSQLRKHSSIDIEEVIPYFVKEHLGSYSLLKKLCDTLQFLFIDEFQDVNAAQYKLITILADYLHIFAIGDPDQSIYGFRGSNPDFFFTFIDSYKAENITLTKNYRSGPAILKAASTVIDHNSSTHRKPVVPEIEDDFLIEHYQSSTPEQEAEFVVSRIEEALGGTSHFSLNSGRVGGNTSLESFSFGDIAVLYRLSQQANPLRQALERSGIPFQVVDVKPYFMQPHIRAAYYWIQVADGHGDITDYLSLLRHFKGVGQQTIRQIEKDLLFSTIPFFDAVFSVSLPAKLKGIVNEIKVFIGLFKSKVERAGLSSALLEVFDILKIDSEIPEAERLVDLAGSFGKNLSEFAGHLKRNSRATVYDDKAESVSLMTMHSAKGLEFPMVIVTGVEEGIIPCTVLSQSNTWKDTTTSEFVSEERRLFYVAMTRAKKRLVLTSSKSRTIYGKTQQHELSQFVREIPEVLLEQVVPRVKKKKRGPVAVQMKLF